jgi:hypothetical protein
MNVRRHAVLIAVAMLSLTRAASSAPSPGLAAMGFFDGTWSCKRTANPDRTLVGTQFAFRAVPDGQWIVESFSDGQIHISYDAATHRYVFAYLGTNGASERLTSPGWLNDSVRLVKTASSDGGPAGAATFTRHGPAVFTSSYVTGGARYDNICAKLSS